MINKKRKHQAFNAIFNISGNAFRGRSKPVEIVVIVVVVVFFFRVKFRRCAEGAEKLRFYSNTINFRIILFHVSSFD